jgi:hypothetical protein
MFCDISPGNLFSVFEQPNPLTCQLGEVDAPEDVTKMPGVPMHSINCA